MLLGPGILWIGVEIASEEERFKLDGNGKPIEGFQLEIFLLNANVTRSANGTIEIKATLDNKELPKLRQIIPGLEVGADTLLPPGAQDFVQMNDSGFSDNILRPTVFVETKQTEKFRGVGLYSANIALPKFDVLVITGYADPNRRAGNDHVGYIGEHESL
jgi:hypothetical protein